MTLKLGHIYQSKNVFGPLGEANACIILGLRRNRRTVDRDYFNISYSHKRKKPSNGGLFA